MGIEDHLRRDAGIAAADDHGVGRLAALGELAIAVALGRHPTDEEIAIALDEAKREFRHVGHESSSGRSVCVLAMRGPTIAMQESAFRSPRRILPAQDDAGLTLRLAPRDAPQGRSQ